MSFNLEIYELLKRYTKDLDGTDITLAELQNLPWWRCVWGWWKALAYYKMNDNYERLEDVPDGLDNFTIMGEVRTQYHCIKGIKSEQSMTKEECKRIYGQ
jgi:hypothetical protein